MSKILANGLRIAAIQMKVGTNKTDNVSHAIDLVRRAAATTEGNQQRPQLIALPECFNSPYGTKFFGEYAEAVPDGYTCGRLAEVARELGIYLVGGTIPERLDDRLFNTCTVWSPSGELIAKYQKMHLFDIDVKDGIRFKESDVLTAGSEFVTFNIDDFKIGLGICYDIRFEEHARVYRNLGCDMLLYPSAFNMTTGPMHWELLQRGRANDLQLHVATVSPARDESAGYVAWGHTMIVDTWGKIVSSAAEGEEIVFADIDTTLNAKVRSQIPVSLQRRLDMYETQQKKQ